MLGQVGYDAFDDLVFDVFVFCCGFDHEIGCAERGYIKRRADAGEASLHIGFCDEIARHLAHHVFLNLGERGCERVLAEIIERNVIPRERHNMRDTIAHLACTDDADCFDIHAALLRG